MEEILHQLLGSLSHYLQGVMHPRWLTGFLPSTVPSVQELLASAAHFAGFFWEKSGEHFPSMCPQNLLPFCFVRGFSRTIGKQITSRIVNFLSLQQHFNHFCLAKKNNLRLTRGFSKWLLLYLLGTLMFSNRSLEQLLRASRKSHSRKSQWTVSMAWSQWRSSSPSLANRTSIWAAILEPPFLLRKVPGWWDRSPAF